jgi:hypothetical protein
MREFLANHPRARPDSAYGSSPRSRPRRGVTTQLYQNRGTMNGTAQSSALRREGDGRVQVRGDTRAMRPSGPRNGRPSRRLEQWIAQTVQNTPTEHINEPWQPDDSVVWRGVIPEPSRGPPMIPMVGRIGFQQPSNPGRWEGSYPGMSYQPRRTYLPSTGRPDLRRPVSFEYVPGAVEGLENAATAGRVDLGHAPDSAFPRQVPFRPVEAMQRSRGRRGHRGSRGPGFARRGEPEPLRYYRL